MSVFRFCDQNNIVTCFNILSSELEILGFTEVEYDGNEKQNIINLLNTSWSMINSFKKQALKVKELNEKLLTFNGKIGSLEDVKKKNDFTLENEKKKCLKLEESLSKVKDEKDKLAYDLKESKKSLTRSELEIKNFSLQHRHDIHRKDAEIAALKDKLFSLLGSQADVKSNKTCEIDANITVDPSIYSKYILNLQNNIQLLLGENVNLRTAIVHIYKAFLEQRKGNFQEEERLFKLPYQALIDEIEENVKKIIDAT